MKQSLSLIESLKEKVYDIWGCCRIIFHIDFVSARGVDRLVHTRGGHGSPDGSVRSPVGANLSMTERKVSVAVTYRLSSVLIVFRAKMKDQTIDGTDTWPNSKQTLALLSRRTPVWVGKPIDDK